MIDTLQHVALRERDFTKVADRGFGDQRNSYAHTMTWFKDYIYVGTTRANLCLVKANDQNSMKVWPISCPSDVYDLDLRAQIWRYDLRLKHWQRVFVSPMVPGVKGVDVPRELGYRGMTVFRGRSDPGPTLYISGWAPSRAGKVPTILRSQDGVTFQPVSQLGNDPSITSYRTLMPFNGRLYTSPTGKSGKTANISELPLVLESSDPASEPWRSVSTVGFGDEENISIFEMATFNGHLYAGTVNPKSGFQIWKTRAEGTPPYRWTRVITEGAYRGSLNEGTSSMCVFKNALYVGSGIQRGGYDKVNKVGPAAAELIRIHPDDSWDLIAGTPRWTPQGLKLPLSGGGPGFDDFFNGYFWRMAEHGGSLYLGTYNWSVFLPYLGRDSWFLWAERIIEQVGMHNVVAEFGGFDLWQSSDGANWYPVTQHGFGNPYNYGVRTLQSTPFGLFVGTANPFGPDLAVETQRGWRYAHNPEGGLEVWVGAPKFSRNGRTAY